MTLLGDARKARRMKRKMERAAPSKRETVIVEGETTPKKELENNDEFNMAPRGSFNHLIESPACLGSPPSFAPRLSRLVFISTNTFERTDDYLRTNSRALSFFPLLVALSLSTLETFPRRGPFSSTLQYPVALMAKLIGVRLGIRG